MKRFIAACCLIVMMLSLAIPARAEELYADDYAGKILQYYRHYRTDALPEIEDCFAQMEEVYPEEAAHWRKILDRWIWADTQMPVEEGVLPDGLPEDDSLCIVVLGYALTENGVMQPELLERLKVTQASAEKYPNAWILLTGGGTAFIEGVTEAGEMRSWLIGQGIDEKRIIMDTEAMSTTENAINSCRIVTQEYPQITTLTVVTSDYHCRWGAALLSVAAWLEQGDALQVVSGACSRTDKRGYDSYYSQLWGIVLMTGIHWYDESVPELYIPRETEPMVTASAQSVKPVSEEHTEKDQEPQWNPVWIVLFASPIGIYLVTRKRKKKEPLS